MSPQPVTRRFATILFTDIVGSTVIARELGDRRWRELVRRHHAIVRRELKRFDGKELDTAGDGFFVIFESPGAAIRCAAAICTGVREIGLEVRAGVHGGELESGAAKPGGIAVNTAARVMSVAGPGEVFVSSSMRDVVAGSSLEFHDHGLHQLKGLDGEWRLYSLLSVDGARLEEPLDPAEASRRRLAIEPPERERPSSRTVALVIGAIAAIAVAVVVAGVVASRGDDHALDGPIDGTARKGPPSNSLSKLDPQSEQLLFTRSDLPGSTQDRFHDLEAGAGSVWLVRSPNILKIDPQDGSSVPVRGLSGLLTSGIDVGDAGVWLVGGTLYEVDPATGVAGDPIRFVPPDLPAPTTASDITVGFGSVWLSLSQGEVIRIDPETERSSAIEVGETPDAMATGSEYIWVLDEFAGAAWRIDPETERILHPIHLSGGLDRVAIGEGFVWVLDSALGILTPIDETSGEPRPAIAVGSDAEDVAVGLGSAWVASGGDVLEVDPVTLRVERTIAVSDAPILRLAVDGSDGTIWLDFAPGAAQ